MIYLEIHFKTNHMKFFGWGLVRKLKLDKYLRRRIFLLKKMSKNSICAEIGVAQGHFSFKILKYVKPKELYLIDPWEYKENWSKENIEHNNVWSKENQDLRYQLVKKKFEGKYTWKPTPQIAETIVGMIFGKPIRVSYTPNISNEGICVVEVTTIFLIGV